MLFFAVFPLFTTVMGDGAEQKKKIYIRVLFCLDSSVQVEKSLYAMERCDAILSNRRESYNGTVYRSRFVIAAINAYIMFTYQLPAMNT